MTSLELRYNLCSQELLYSHFHSFYIEFIFYCSVSEPCLCHWLINIVLHVVVTPTINYFIATYFTTVTNHKYAICGDRSQSTDLTTAALAHPWLIGISYQKTIHLPIFNLWIFSSFLRSYYSHIYLEKGVIYLSLTVLIP